MNLAMSDANSKAMGLPVFMCLAGLKVGIRSDTGQANIGDRRFWQHGQRVIGLKPRNPGFPDWRGASYCYPMQCVEQ